MDRLTASVEEACLNAWPALKEIFYDGWLIRLAKGETRRTNSVNAIGQSTRALDEKIAHCECIYDAHGQPTYFRIRSFDDHMLEDVLEARGFRAENDTRTLFMDFAEKPPAPPDKRFTIELTEGRPSTEWLTAHADFVSSVDHSSRNRLLDLVALPIVFAAARGADGTIASVAYGAVHDRIVSLQWVATDPMKRRSGLSRATLSALLCWSHSRTGASGACLRGRCGKHARHRSV